MNNSNLVLIFFIILNIILVLKFTEIKLFHYNIDKPDKLRKFHSKPTPLAGGQIIYLNIIIYWIFLNISENFLTTDIFFEDKKSLNNFMIISSGIFFLGFIDDKLNLKANLKFFILFLLILTLLMIDKGLIIDHIKISFLENNFTLGYFGIFFSIFCFLVFLNAFNMFDGINLQSSSYSILIFVSFLIFFTNSLLIQILITSLIGFSYLNVKNKSFLGDSGSLLIAFLISYFFIRLYNLDYIEYADEIVLYMIIPGLDLIRLFVIRILKAKNPLSSDRMHLHHLLINKFSLKKTLIIILLLISIPIILSQLNINNIYSIIIAVLNYSILLFYISQKN